ncbi:MAG: tetratricopeptide repeat protein, partial [Planctomycetota bacterium]
MTRYALRVLFLLPCVLFALRADAGGVPEARRLMEREEYDKVDDALREELAGTSPSEEALRLSLRASLASGRIFTAQRRITTLLRVTGSKDADVVFEAAHIAQLAGDERMAVTRYVIYLRMDAGANERTERALRYVLSRDAHPDQFFRFAEQHPDAHDLWPTGTRQIDLLLAQDEPAKAVEVGEALAQRSPSRGKVGYLAQKFVDAGNNLLMGKDAAVRYGRPLDLLLSLAAPAVDPTYYEHFYNGLRGGLSPEDRVRYLVRIRRKLGSDSPDRMLDSFDEMRNIKSGAARIAAGREFLELEDYYAGSPAHYEKYLSKILGAAQVFRVAGKPLVDGAAIRQKLARLKRLAAQDGRELSHWIIEQIARQYLEENARVAFYEQHFTVLPSRGLYDLLRLTKWEDAERLCDTWAAGDPVREAAAAHHLVEHYNRSGDKEKLLTAADRIMTWSPGEFDEGRIRDQVLRSRALSPAEKAELLQDVGHRAGYGNRLRNLVRELGRDRDAKGDPAVQAVMAEAAKGSMDGSDPLLTAHNLLCGKRRKGADIDSAVKRALGEFQGDVPGDWDQVTRHEEALMLMIHDKHRALSWNNREACMRWAAMWAPRMRLGSRWESMVKRPREHNRHSELVRKVLPHFLSRVQADDEVPADVWWRWGEVNFLQNLDSQLLSARTMARMPWGLPVHLVLNLRRHFDRNPAKFFEVLGRAGAATGYEIADDRTLTLLIEEASRKTDRTARMPVRFLERLGGLLEEREARERQIDHVSVTRLIGCYVRGGMLRQGRGVAARYLDRARQAGKRELALAYRHLLGNGVLPVERPGRTDPLHANHVLFAGYLPLLEELGDGVEGLPVAEGAIGLMSNALRKKEMARFHEQCRAGLRTCGRMIATGIGRVGDTRLGFEALDAARDGALESGDHELLGRSLLAHAGLVGRERWDDAMKRRVEPTVSALKKRGLHEFSYSYLNAILARHQVPAEHRAQLSVMRSQAGQHIPGLIAVDHKHPAYQLHLAAYAFGSGDQDKAWELASKKLSLLAQNWPALDPAFVTWCVDHMRKRKRLKPALDLCFHILLKEQSLDPETAAAISLTKGDVYRDMSNFQAAKIEYESLIANQRYAKTAGGKDAALHLIDLQITTGNYAGAEVRLERMVNSGDLQLQAEAFYFKGAIAFAQKDYKISREMLDQVFKRRHDHVQARLLEGELKLKLPRGLADLEVKVGSRKLATIVIPGRALPLRLRDSNLAIARGGAAIPVVITTSKGGDLERVELLPSPADRTLFSVTIPTALGTVQKSNYRLEVCGDDTVSYSIDPEFQRANRLSYPAKSLTVRAEGRLLISSGEILDEIEAEKRELEARLREEREGESARFGGRSGNVVRPGSPIFAQVVDLDRDLSDAADKVTVDCSTDSGDVLTGVELTETGPHTGVFRGSIPTGLPAPLAKASDTEEDRSP